MKERLTYFDGLKGISAVGICAFHYGSELCGSLAQAYPIPAYGLFVNGYLAVELFFMLSGFLMAGKYAGRRADMCLWAYIYPKLRRIMPCFLLANAVIVVAALLDGSFLHSQMMPKVTLWRAVGASTPFSVGWAGLYFPYAHVGWFISVLFLCYVLYYYTLKLKDRYPSFYFPLCIAMVFFGTSLLELDWGIPFLYRWTARGYLCFYLGVLLYHLFQQKFNRRLIATSGAVFLVVLAILIHRYGMEAVLGNVRYSFVFIIYPILLLIITELTTIQKILSFPPISYLGKISMPIYLLQIPMFQIIKQLNCVLGGGWMRQVPEYSVLSC